MSAAVNRDQMLADFQACTGIDDAGEALGHLEEANWDLVHAVNRVLPPDTQALPSERSPEVVYATPRVCLPMEQDPSEAEVPQVRRQPSASMNVSVEVSKRNVNTGESETSSDVEDLTESYPLEEDFFDHIDEVRSRPEPAKHLIEDNVMSELMGTTQFVDNFRVRYGDCHPMFYQGTLEDAFKEATNKPAKDRKPLALYLHHDGSVCSNVFCTQILCAESIVSYMTNNLVIWGWDMSHDSNAQIRGSNEFNVITSSVRSQDELLGQLMNVIETFKPLQLTEIREEEEREARELMKREQDAAYQASLSADRAKDEAKRAVEEKKRQEEAEHLQKLAEVEAERAAVARSLPPEPGPECKEPVCSLKCRMPGGKIVSRKFLRSSQLKILFEYLFTEGYSRDTYKFLTTYPKRDLTALEENMLMQDIFSAQDTLIVEER